MAKQHHAVGPGPYEAPEGHAHSIQPPKEPPHAKEPAFKVSARVKFMELDGEITEAVLQPGGEYLYSVKVPAAAGQHHTHDTFGCVPGWEIA